MRMSEIATGEEERMDVTGGEETVVDPTPETAVRADDEEEESGSSSDEEDDDGGAIDTEETRLDPPPLAGEGLWQGYELETENMETQIGDCVWKIENDFGLGMEEAKRCPKCFQTTTAHKSGSFSYCRETRLTPEQLYRDVASQLRVCEAIRAACDFATDARQKIAEAKDAEEAARREAAAAKVIAQSVKQRLTAVMRSRIQMRRCVRLILDAATGYLRGVSPSGRFTAVLEAAKIDLCDDYVREDEENWEAMDRGANVKDGEIPFENRAKKEGEGRPPTPGSASADAAPHLHASRPIVRPAIEDVLEVSVPACESDLDQDLKERDLRETLTRQPARDGARPKVEAKPKVETTTRVETTSRAETKVKVSPREDPGSLFSATMAKKIEKLESRPPNRDRDYREEGMKEQLDNIGERASARAQHQEDVRRKRMDELDLKHAKERRQLEKEMEDGLMSRSKPGTSSHSFAFSATPEYKNHTPPVRSAVQFPPLRQERGRSTAAGGADDEEDER